MFVLGRNGTDRCSRWLLTAGRFALTCPPPTPYASLRLWLRGRSESVSAPNSSMDSAPWSVSHTCPFSFTLWCVSAAGSTAAERTRLFHVCVRPRLFTSDQRIKKKSARVLRGFFTPVG